MLKRIHLVAGAVATVIIATFFVATIYVELLGTEAAVVHLKRLIVTPGLFLLIPFVALTGATGFKLSRSRQGRLVELKRKRMLVIAAVGVLLLVPCALVLDRCASQGLFNATFYAVQAVELLAGATNLTLMGMNIRDGLKLSGRLKRVPLRAAS